MMVLAVSVMKRKGADVILRIAFCFLLACVSSFESASGSYLHVTLIITVPDADSLSAEFSCSRKAFWALFLLRQILTSPEYIEAYQRNSARNALPRHFDVCWEVNLWQIYSQRPVYTTNEPLNDPQFVIVLWNLSNT